MPKSKCITVSARKNPMHARSYKSMYGSTSNLDDLFGNFEKEGICWRVAIKVQGLRHLIEQLFVILLTIIVIEAWEINRFRWLQFFIRSIKNTFAGSSNASTTLVISLMRTLWILNIHCLGELNLFMIIPLALTTFLRFWSFYHWKKIPLILIL